MDARTRELVVTIIIGIVAGYLASIVVGGAGGLLRYLISGLLGAFVGTYALSALGVNLGIKNALVSQIATSTIGAIIVLIIAGFLR
jgi:uncharacterized membrane protein YeaQ/YmgE (transglycosylase-associated protein family)